jgi:hypothetical protein
LCALVALLAGGAVVVARWNGPAQPSGDKPLEGDLTVLNLAVLIRPAGAGEPLLVNEPGAVPVRAGASMSLQVNLNQPAYAYLVWISNGRVVPLYPWNNDLLEVTDIDQPPPVRRPTDVLICPMLGTSWPFGKRPGLETVLLLVRRTPLPNGTRLGSLLGSLPAGRVRQRGELAVLGMDAEGSVSTLLAQDRGPEEEARAADEPLRALLVRLHDHFELIRVVRFAHEGE